jgi:uncharacterized protein (TIGR00725 family)
MAEHDQVSEEDAIRRAKEELGEEAIAKLQGGVAVQSTPAMMSHVRRLPIVAVIGSGDPDHGNPDLSSAIGRLIAEMGFHLLTGGGHGVMADACRGFTSVPDRAGLTLGIIPRSITGDEAKEGYPNPWVELPIRTHLAGRLGPDGEDSRNPINVLTAWKIIALPGSDGTRAEIRLALRYGRPVLAVTDNELEREEESFLGFLKKMGIEHQEVRRVGGRWDLTGVRGFLHRETVGTWIDL